MDCTIDYAVQSTGPNVGRTCRGEVWLWIVLGVITPILGGIAPGCPVDNVAVPSLETCVVDYETQNNR